MTRWRIAAGSTLAVLGLSACVVAPYYPYDNGYSTSGEWVTDVPPPASRVEVIPAIPFAGAVWLGGYWGWHSGRHHWVPGRWAQPRPGYNWRPHRWEPIGGRWHFRGGGWMRH
jgi:hypothetical protein